MPNCLIHLSLLSPQDRRIKEEENPTLDVFVSEDPKGVFHNLEKDTTYYVYVEQEADQLRRDQERMRQIALQMEGAPTQGPSPIGMDILSAGHWESCSCIYGTPCVDEYGCRDWKARYKVAAANASIAANIIEDKILGVKPRMF